MNITLNANQLDKAFIEFLIYDKGLHVGVDANVSELHSSRPSDPTGEYVVEWSNGVKTRSKDPNYGGALIDGKEDTDNLLHKLWLEFMDK